MKEAEIDGSVAIIYGSGSRWRIPPEPQILMGGGRAAGGRELKLWLGIILQAQLVVAELIIRELPVQSS